MVDRNLFVQGPHTQQLWDDVADLVSQIEQLKFLQELASGELDQRVFVHYITQDSWYLAGYAKAMSLLASKAVDRDEAQFWATSASQAVAMEEAMHADLLAEPTFAQIAHQQGVTQPSPTTLGYTSYLVAQASVANYGVGVAGVLPCFWVYAHVGKVLIEQVGDGLATNPYRTWIEAYDSVEFDESTQQAVGILESVMNNYPADRELMAEVFRQAVIYELHFWAAAHAVEDWSI